MELLKQKICFVVYFIQSQSHNATAMQYHNFMTCMSKFVYPSYYSELYDMFPKLAEMEKVNKSPEESYFECFQGFLGKAFFWTHYKKIERYLPDQKS